MDLNITTKEFKKKVYDKKIPRNKKVTVEKDGNTMELKYKKAESYVEDGWILAKQ